MITVIIQLLTLFSDPDIKTTDKIRFLPQLIFSLLFPASHHNINRTFFLDGLPFYYLGSHKNIILDHLISHLNVYKRYYSRAKIIVDVGASFGTFPRIVTYFNPSARVFSLEMAKPSFDLLKLNTAVLPNTKCFQYALGDRKRQVNFYYNDQYPEGSLINSREKTNSLVDMITLDDFIRQNKISQINVLKIDTEGFELKVLTGAKKTLAITDYLIVEIDFSNSNLRQVEKLLFNAGFELINFGEINFNHQTNRIGSCDLIFTKNGHSKALQV